MFKPFLQSVYLAIGVLPLFIGACSAGKNPAAVDEGHDPAGGQGDQQRAALVQLDVVEDNGVRIELYGPQTLRTGYVDLMVKLSDATSGAQLEGAQIEIRPRMQMETDEGLAQHGAPSESPAVAQPAEGTYANPVVLLMPGSWQLEVNYVHEGREGKADFAAEVDRGDYLAALVGEDGRSYFVALLAPQRPLVGKQDLEVAVYVKESMLSFPRSHRLSRGARAVYAFDESRLARQRRARCCRRWPLYR